jgi:hypothetical protein
MEKLQADLESAGEVGWLAIKDSILDVNNDSVENSLLMKVKKLFNLPLFMVKYLI